MQFNAPVDADADEGVAADLLAPFNRLQQEGRARLLHQLQIDGDGRLQVGGEFARDRDEISRPPRKGAEGVEGGGCLLYTPTMVMQGDRVYVQAGGGIVADSDPAAEYQESVNKASALLVAVARAEEGTL